MSSEREPATAVEPAESTGVAAEPTGGDAASADVDKTTADKTTADKTTAEKDAGSPDVDKAAMDKSGPVADPWAAFAPVPVRPPGRIRRVAGRVGRLFTHEWT